MILPRHVRSGTTPLHPCAPPGADAEAGNHLVEDQQDAVARADVAQALQKARLRQHHAHVAGDRLDDQRGDLIGKRLAQPLDRRQVVVRGEQRVGGRRARDAGARRHAERRQARAGLHEKLIGVPVIAALELDDLLAPRVRPRHAHRAHRRFGAGADEAHASRSTASSIRTSSPSSTSSSVGAPKLVPCRAAASSAFTRPPGACP